ncbi:MAG TPA: methyltransferase domain-containing protein [Flavisolibacter sp.]|nr:methyltransferase domain-containing protein [Flavisolibacter sp.]
MSAKEWYREWFDSAFYHKLYFGRDEAEARQFITRLLDHLQPPAGSSMLDVACGRGRHSIFLAEKGYDVTGIDLSPESIHFAKQFEHEHLHFYQHDMRLPAWINFFDYAFNFFTSFGYFATRREHDDSVSMIAKSLKRSGTVLFDYLNVHFVEEHLIHNEIKKIGNTTYEIHRWMDDRNFYKKIIVSDPSVDRRCEYTEQVAKLSVGDFTDMLSFQDMQVTELFGDYELNRYDVRKTPRMIVIAKKN